MSDKALSTSKIVFISSEDKGLKLRYKKDFDDNYSEFKEMIWNMTFDNVDDVYD